MLRTTIAVLSFLSATPMLLEGQASPSAVTPNPASIDAFVRRGFALGLTPGLGIAVVADGKVLYTAGLGMADREKDIPVSDSTYWYVASTSKSFTGFAIALMEAAGEIRVTDPITRLLPQAKWYAGTRPEELTLASFLSHTHGLGDGAVVETAAFTGVFGDDHHPALLEFSAPQEGRVLSYSNLGYNVASMVIDARHREGWKQYMKREIFQKAGLNHIYATMSNLPIARIAKSHRLQPDGSFTTQPFEKRDITMNAAGGHLATIRDLASWTLLHLDEGKLDGRPVFPAKVVRRSHEILGGQPPGVRFAYFARDGWGMGWDIGTYEGEPMVSRFGSYTGFRSHLSMLPGKRVGVVAQVNAATGSGLTDVIAAYVYDLALGKGDAEAKGTARLDSLAARLSVLEKRAAEARADAAERARQPLIRPAADYAGRYEDAAYGPVIISSEASGLRLKWGVLEAGLAVYDAGQHQMVADLPMGQTIVKFSFAETGPATALEIDGRTLPAVR